MAKQAAPQKANTTKAAPATSWFADSRRLALILGVIALLAYANTLNNGFALDDFIAIRNNAIVTKGASAIPELLSTPYHWGNGMADNLYRPLSLVMFAVEYQLSDGSPLPGHLINILLFASCVILLFRFLDALFEQKKTAVAFIAALLFALHPIHTEVVANIKSRDELLCFFFGFMALNIFAGYAATGKTKQLVTGGGYLFLSLLSKETAITLLAVIPLVFYFYRNEDKKRSLYITLSSLLAAGVFLAIRFAVLNAHNAGNAAAISLLDNSLTAAPTMASHIATAVLVLGNYLKLLFVPWPLICDYSYNSIPNVTFGNMGVLFSVAAYFLLAGCSIYLLMKKRKNPFAFGILFFLITISLFSNIPFLLGAVMAERFVFFASAGFCLLVALALEKWIVKTTDNNAAVFTNKAARGIVLAICLLYAGITIARNTDWVNNNTLYKTDVLKAPNNCRLYYYLGTDLVIAASEQTDPVAKRQLIDEGIINLKKSLAIYPDFAMANAEVGNEYFATAQYDSAEVYNKKAIALNPLDTNAGNNLAAVYFYAQKYQQSLDVCRKVVAQSPGYARGYINMGSCYQHMNQPDSAIYYFRKAAATDPTNRSAYMHMAKVFRAMGNLDSAMKYEGMGGVR